MDRRQFIGTGAAAGAFFIAGTAGHVEEGGTALAEESREALDERRDREAQSDTREGKA